MQRADSRWRSGKPGVMQKHIWFIILNCTYKYRHGLSIVGNNWVVIALSCMTLSVDWVALCLCPWSHQLCGRYLRRCPYALPVPERGSVVNKKRWGPPSFHSSFIHSGMWRRRTDHRVKWLLRTLRGQSWGFPLNRSDCDDLKCFQKLLHPHCVCLWRNIGVLNVPWWARSNSSEPHCAGVCCCEMQGHTDDEGMSLVLASLSSSFCIIQRFVIQRNVLWVAFRGPFGPFLVWKKRCCKMQDWLLYSLLWTIFLTQTYDDTVFQCVSLDIVPFLCFPKHGFSLFVQGLVDKCMSMWRITVVARSRNVWEIKGASFDKQHVRQSVRRSIFSC